MTKPSVVPALPGQWLADLIADASAIPAAAFSRNEAVGPPQIDLTVIPQQRSVLRIPDASLSLATDAEYCF